MYSVVLATVLTAGSAAPDCWFGGCFSSCHGCSGYSGCSGCYGSGCWGYGACTGWSCYGSCNGYGCWGSCSGYYSGCTGCYGSCYGSCAGAWSPYGMSPASGGTVVPSGGTGMPKANPEVKVGLVPASVVIKAPAEVKLTVNGQPTALASLEQRFGTPPLEVGRSYSYEIVATTMRDGKELSQTRKVIVRAGQESRVDFSDLVATPADSNGKVIANR